MPRPKKCRKVCCLPDNDGFVPVRGGEELTPIVLNVDEYESIRLIDREGFFSGAMRRIYAYFQNNGSADLCSCPQKTGRCAG